MIPGVVASQALGSGGGLTGTVMDFVNGQYVIDSVEYALSDLFGDGAIGTVDFGAVVAGRGWLSTYDDINRPSAIGPLKAKLLLPHTAIIEWEDLEGGFFEGMFLYVDGGVDKVEVVQTSNIVFEIAGWGLESISDADYRYFGVNKLAITLGEDDDTRSCFNGGVASAPITIMVHPAYSYDEVYPFGAEVSSVGSIDGFVRRLTILEAQSASELSAHTALETPAMVGDLSAPSKTSTTVTLAFSDLAGATSYEYWIGSSGDGPLVNDFDWFALAGNKIVTGLTPNTAYEIYVRGVNDDGPGGNDFSSVSVTTDP